jgi:hypothetical protein
MAVRGGGGRSSPAARRASMTALMRLRILFVVVVVDTLVCAWDVVCGGGVFSGGVSAAANATTTVAHNRIKQRTDTKCAPTHPTHARTNQPTDKQTKQSERTPVQQPVQLRATSGSSGRSRATTRNVGAGQNAPPSPSTYFFWRVCVVWGRCGSFVQTSGATHAH